MTHKICLIIPHHISFQPRSLREADSLDEGGWDVKVVSRQSDPLLVASDRRLIRDRKWKLETVDLRRDDIFSNTWFLESLQTRIARTCFGAGFHSVFLAVKGYIPGAKRIMKLAVSEKADWFIAHTQAALPLAASCAKRWKARLGFDCEDLLTENGTDPPEIVRLIERKFLPLCDYVTVPSKQIGSRLVKDYGVRSPIVLYNAFPQRLAKILVPPEERPRNSRIRLCWFGQTIGPGRGIEEAIIALGKLGQKVELHLRGRLSKDYQTTLVKLMASVDGGSRLNFLPLVDHEKLMQDMGQFDVGLCLERIERTNYALTVTNKLFAYLLAGLAVAATDTPGQREILEQIPSAGFLYPAGNPESLAKGLERWIDNLETLRSAQQAAWNAARERFCWDKEKEKFLRIFN